METSSLPPLQNVPGGDYVVDDDGVVVNDNDYHEDEDHHTQSASE